jgi:phosphatidylserine/phosphatidylglycerophosphate/cardiolipin synthase-like enzyme
MQAARRSRLRIIMVLPKRPEAFTEEIAVGFAQAKMLRTLQEVAHETGHAFGVYYTAATGADGQEKPTYIHAKLLLVDDRFLTVGSANTTNRSMGLDTELNIAWEAVSSHQQALIQSIHSTRISLLAEHCGVDLQREHFVLGHTGGLVDYLNDIAVDPRFRLRRHPMDTSFGENGWLRFLKPNGLVLDPERPFLL